MKPLEPLKMNKYIKCLTLGLSHSAGLINVSCVLFSSLLLYALREIPAFLISSEGYLNPRRSETIMIPSPASTAPYQSGLLYSSGQFAPHDHPFLLTITPAFA